MKHSFFNQYKFKYLEWNDAQVIHEVTLQWKSQIEFIHVEQAFLGELLTEHTLTLLAETGYEHAKHLAVALDNLEKEIVKLQDRISTHLNEIKVLTDGKDDFQAERTFQDAHLLLEMKIESYVDKYNLLKEEVFTTMKTVFAKSKHQQIN
ncbi:hypothetical protein DCS32_15815 [Dokdonia sp. Dokd-P16]|uniref:hypothetical protein n=1 Tax=Dokdonia sp. Dokd-P16 TaxID=2173169 RepID=UPI000D549C98|nr:hypothetical protein [Dokdonia sp. Dokd-P16]AWH75574.1 hypothetical protein DCS32_15815 [Dokdonia sp. Dokd-P16]